MSERRQPFLMNPRFRLKRSFTVNAIWEEDCGKFISQSDISGLHIEATTIDELEVIMNDVAAELIVANHMNRHTANGTLKDAGIARKP